MRSPEVEDDFHNRAATVRSTNSRGVSRARILGDRTLGLLQLFDQPP